MKGLAENSAQINFGIISILYSGWGRRDTLGWSYSDELDDNLKLAPIQGSWGSFWLIWFINQRA